MTTNSKSTSVDINMLRSEGNHRSKKAMAVEATRLAASMIRQGEYRRDCPIVAHTDADGKMHTILRGNCRWHALMSMPKNDRAKMLKAYSGLVPVILYKGLTDRQVLEERIKDIGTGEGQAELTQGDALMAISNFRDIFPSATETEIAEKMHWYTHTGAPNRSRIQPRLKVLEMSTLDPRVRIEYMKLWDCVPQNSKAVNKTATKVRVSMILGKLYPCMSLDMTGDALRDMMTRILEGKEASGDDDVKESSRVSKESVKKAAIGCKSLLGTRLLAAMCGEAAAKEFGIETVEYVDALILKLEKDASIKKPLRKAASAKPKTKK